MLLYYSTNKWYGYNDYWCVSIFSLPEVFRVLCWCLAFIYLIIFIKILCTKVFIDFMSNANANDIIIAKQHVVSSTYERRIYAVVIFSALKSEKGGVFRGIRTSKKITIPASSLWQIKKRQRFGEENKKIFTFCT